MSEQGKEALAKRVKEQSPKVLPDCAER